MYDSFCFGLLMNGANEALGWRWLCVDQWGKILSIWVEYDCFEGMGWCSSCCVGNGLGMFKLHLV